MTKTTEGERAGALGEPRIHDLDFLTRLIHDADRLARYERDLFDERAEREIARIYFEIAAEALGEDEVRRRRDERIAAAPTDGMDYE